MEPSIEHIVISPEHNFVGHFGGSPGTNPALYKESVKLIPGSGIDGDRYTKREEGHRKQITFFDMETIDSLSEFTGRTVPPDTVRRNVFVRGIDLPALVGKSFSIQGVQFEGVDPCPPCQWMNEVVGDGAKDQMEGRGGLRARILTDGSLTVGPANLEINSEGNQA
jgi:MOSC domain-containing protein YiiM